MGALIAEVANQVGWPLSDEQQASLLRYGQWLAGEALAAGGIGPNEGERIEERHLADSLLFAAAWKSPAPPETLVDLGSGVGLPGIPLALLWPQAEVRLVERAGRRVDLARRAIRMLELANVTVVQADVDAFRADPPVDMVVSRALSAPDRALGWSRRLLRSGGVAVVGGSHLARPEPAAGEEIHDVSGGVLDRPVWLRIMAAP